MATKKGKFDELLASQVAGGISIKDAALKVGCSLTHAYHISSSPAFQSRVSTIRSEAVQNASGKLSRIASKAVDALEQILDSDDAKDRLNAVKMVLTHLVPLAEHSELRDRLDRLEQSSSLKVVS
jgi:hypothetical protein